MLTHLLHLDEIREIALGIHPGSLAEGGMRVESAPRQGITLIADLPLEICRPPHPLSAFRKPRRLVVDS